MVKSLKSENMDFNTKQWKKESLRRYNTQDGLNYK